MKKLIIILLIVILGQYIGFDFSNESSCNKQYRQNVIRLTITKPFVVGFWQIYLGIGNKHLDPITYFEDRSDDGVLYPHTDSCEYAYVNGYDVFGDWKFIDLTPWTSIIN